ncbi:NDR1/HIN1-like protein 10 [Curcuma longa]|uniref:NDR1/HIN1-like protein 10 n=1 Tax=Curcuma longa TaxID=136217 RepID=UPI003D9E6223
MADAKQQVHLNGAYYGPPVPPRQHSFRSVGRSSRCCCNLFKFFLSLVITVGVVVLVLWLVFRPNEPRVRVDTASLVRFDLDGSSSTLFYNLSLGLTVRNPNRRLSFYYDRLEARAEYDGNRFGFSRLPTFHQGHKNTTVIGPILFDSSQRLFRDSVGETYRRETSEGFYYIDVKVRAKMRVKVWIFRLRYNRPHIDCTLKLPVPGTGGNFESTGCDVDIF